MVRERRRAFLKGISALLAGAGLTFCSHPAISREGQIDKTKGKNIHSLQDMDDPLIMGNWWV